MIIRNDFRQHDDTAKTIDHEMFYVNLILKRIRENEWPQGPYVYKGIIHIDKDADKNEGYFGGALSHEANHIVTDPVTFFNYFSCIQAIKKRLDTKDKMENWLANLASDLIIENDNSKNPLLRDYSRQLYEFINEKIKNQTEDQKKQLEKAGFSDFKLDGDKPRGECMTQFIAIIAKWHGFKCPVEPKYYDKVMDILKSAMSREDKYVALARIFKPLLEQDEKNAPKYIMMVPGKDKDGKSTMMQVPLTEQEKQMLEKAKKLMPINPSNKDIKEAQERIIGESKTVEEAKEKMKLAKELIQNTQTISPEGFQPLELDDQEALKMWYDMQAEKVLVSITFPQIPTRKGLEISHKKWSLSDGLHQMDVKDTIMKKGINIPTVTSLSPKIISKFISQTKQTKPMDLIISQDTSGSTGSPTGSLSCSADYETVLLFAILRMAKRVDQRVGVALWNTRIYYQVPPMGWQRFNELIKKALFANYSSGGTLIQEALDNAVKNTNEFHFVFTDGEVFYGGFGVNELKEYMKKLKGRIHFFLVQGYHNQQFIEACGAESVTDASDLKKLPKIALNQWRNLFWRH